MNDTSGIGNPRVHDHIVSMVANTHDYADNMVIHVILESNFPFYTFDPFIKSISYVLCVKNCFCKIENHLIDVVDIKNHFL